MMISPKRWSAVFPLTLIAASITLVGCKGQETPVAQVPEVVVQTVATQDVQVEKTFTAQTEGSREVEIRPRISGILLKRAFKEGGRVKQGDLLYRIDPAEYVAKVNQAEAQLAQQKTALNKAQRDYARLKPLLAENAVSQRDFDDAQSALENANAGLQAMTAQLETAKLNLSYTRITAPVSGIASISSQPEGALMQGPQTLLTKIVQTNPMYVKFSLSEQEKLDFERWIQSGKLDASRTKLSLKLADGSVYPLNGKLNFTAPQFSTSTGTMQVRAEFPNPSNKLVSGQFGTITIQGMAMRNAILLPQKAVTTTSAGKVVMVVDAENKAQPRQVETGETRGSDVFILKGLQAGDRVVVLGLPKIQAGKPVKVVTAASAVSAS